MPSGKVIWYNAERGFGFVATLGSEDARISKEVLPDGVDSLYPGQRVEYDFASGRRGPQVLRLKLIDPPLKPGETPPGMKKRSNRRIHDGERRGNGVPFEHKYTAEDLNSLISDVMTLFELKIQPSLEKGRFPEHKTGRQAAQILRVIARELEG